MALVVPRANGELPFDIQQLERIILTLADRYNFRLRYDAPPSPSLTTGLAVAGGLLGLYFGGRFGMFAGAIGGAGTAVLISLRQAWDQMRDRLVELYYIVYNYLRSLNVVDYVGVAHVIYDIVQNRERLVRTMLEFIAMRVGNAIVSSLDANY